MITRQKPPGAELIAEPQETGVVQVRRSVVLVGAAALVLMLLLVLWYVAQRPRPEPRAQGSQYRPADVSTLDRDYARRSNAVPPQVERRHIARPVAQADVDPCVIAPTSAQCSALVARRMQANAAPVGAASQVSDASAAAQARSEAAEAARRRAEEQARDLAQARGSDMKVKLDDGGTAAVNGISTAGPGAIAASTSGGIAGNPTGEVPPIGAFVLERGMSIPLTLENAVDSTLGGMVVAQVSEDVYDAAHRAVVIPRGSKAVGEYSDATTQDQARLFCTIDTIKLPNHATLRVDGLACVDTTGRAGIPARADTHRGRTVRDVALMSVLAASAQLAQPQASVFQAPSVGSTIAGSVGSQIANLEAQQLGRSLALGPTLHVDEGTPFAAMVKTDIAAQPYRDW